MNQKNQQYRRKFYVFVPGLAALWLAGCATAPRIVEVESTRRTHTVEIGDRTIFLRDQASLMHMQAHLLPAAEQREEVYVCWSGRAIKLVKLEYRQVNRPDHISEQTFTPAGHASHVFTVGGPDFTDGGAISAWRISLWTDANAAAPVAEKKSTLW